MHVLRPIAQLCDTTQGTTAWLLQPFSWLLFMPEVIFLFQDFPRGPTAPFPCVCDERVGRRVERSPARAHGSWKGFLVVTCSLSSLQLTVQKLLWTYESSRQSQLAEMQAPRYTTSLSARLLCYH